MYSGIHVLKAIRFNQKIRVIGSGHSFTSLCSTDEILVTLDNFQGLISIDREKNQATVKAGTKLSLLGEFLFKEGLAMENMGDINVQSIAGAISTGTHGTGIKNTELFKAAQVSLGCLGIITEVTLQCVPTYKLKLQNKKEKLSDVLATLNERNSLNRNFEFYWIPYTNTAWTKTSNIVEGSEPDKVNFFNYWTEYVLENYVFKLMCEYAKVFPSQNKTVANITAASISNVKKVYHSHKVYATQRMVKFHEMEYNIPAETYQDVFKDVQKIVNSKKFNIHFPIENRWVKGDDVFMSPAYGRDSAYIACHVYNKKDSSAYFTALEEVFKAYDGRPHWGKMNTFTTDDIARMYPKFTDFMTFRKEHDSENIFVNPYLQKLLGI